MSVPTTRCIGGIVDYSQPGAPLIDSKTGHPIDMSNGQVVEKHDHPGAAAVRDAGADLGARLGELVLKTLGDDIVAIATAATEKQIRKNLSPGLTVDQVRSVARQEVEVCLTGVRSRLDTAEKRFEQIVSALNEIRSYTSRISVRADLQLTRIGALEKAAKIRRKSRSKK